MLLEPEVALGAQADLAESPVWDGREAVLRWVDINRGEVHRFDPATQRDSAVALGGTVGSVGLAASGELVVAHGDRFVLLDPATGARRALGSFRADGGLVRFNDGKVDPWGSFHAGTMHRTVDAPVAALYRCFADGRVTEVLPGVTCSNGLDWSPERDRLHYVDSVRGAVQCFRTDPDDGRLLERAGVLEVPGPGAPDGMCLDRDGFLWVALWGGGEVRRVSLEGDVDRVVKLPVSNVSSVAFGGAQLDELYITSARESLSAGQLATEPHAGDLFWCRPGCVGLPPHAFG